MSNQYQLIDRIIDWIVDEGNNKDQIMDLIKANSPSETTYEEIYSLMEEAFDRLFKIYEQQTKQIEVIHQHIANYEKIYAYFEKIKNAAGTNKAMQAKERLLNLLKEGNKMTFRKTETVIHTTSGTIEYDPSKLTSEEQEELKQLLQKATIY